MIGSQPCDQSSSAPPSHERSQLDHRRIYSAILFIPFFYVVVRHLPPIAFFILILAVTLLALWEFYILLLDRPYDSRGITVGLGMGGLILTTMQWPHLLSLHIALFLILLAILAFQLTGWHIDQVAPWQSSAVVFGVLYIGFTLGHFLLIRRLPDGPFLVFFVVLVTWASDAGAYYVGKCFGRHALAPRLSPKKTLEGLLGGTLIALAAAYGASFWFVPSLHWVDCLILGVVLTGVGLLGDLSESAFKRWAGAKDSGTWIPGHGGFLDRVDSLLLTSPTFYYYMTIIKGVEPTWTLTGPGSTV